MAAKMSKRYQTQWAAQFFAAGELTRRRYLVALTNGNANFADLLVQSPKGHHFSVDVKGMSAKNWWLIKKPESTGDLDNRYFILVYVPQDLSPQYCIMSLKEMVDEIKQAEEASRLMEIERGEPYANIGCGGFKFEQAFKYKDRWQTLPDYEAN
jgi:hypothetical protein